MLTTVEETITNASKHWPLTFRHFRLLSTSVPITVKFGRGAQLGDEMESVEAGAWHNCPASSRDYEVIQIVPDSLPCSVKFLLGDGQSGMDRAFGTVDVESDAARLLGIVYGNLGQLAQLAVGGVNALHVSERGYIAGANFASNSAILSVATETVILPASNANGAIVWRAAIWTATNAAANATRIGLLARASSAPSTVLDGDLFLVASSYVPAVSADTGQTYANAQLERPRFVPAGKGLYFINGGNNEIVATRYVDYTLL